MSRAWHRVIAAAAVILGAKSSAAQVAARHIEAFTTGGGVVGATPMRIDNARRVAVYGGFRGDAGLQLDGLGLAFGFRVWELAPTKTFGGAGVDEFITGEWRVSFDTRSIVRVSLGGGFDSIDGGRGPERNGAGGGLSYSRGFGREIFAPSGARVLLSADLLIPNVNTEVDGRRQPVLEFGFGYRYRDLIRFGVAPSR